MRRAVYAFIVIIILALIGGFPAYLAIGQGGNESATVTVTATPAYSPPVGGGGWPGEAGCPAGEVSTAGRATGAGTVTQSFVIKSFDKRFYLFLDEGIVVLTPKGTCPRCIGIHEMTTLPSPPEGAHLVGTVYDVAPDGVTFAPPATLRYSYDPATIPEGISEESLTIASYDSATGEWINLDGVVDTKANTITAKVSQIYDLAVLSYEPAVPTPAIFQPSSLSISPTEVEIGETVNITVLVDNTGGQSGSYQVILKVNGVVEAESEVALDASTSGQVSFSISKDVAGTYLVNVNGLTGSFEVKPEPVVPVTPVEPTPAKPTNWWLIGGIIAAVMVLAFLGYRFRKKLSPLSKRLLPLFQRFLRLLRRLWLQIKRMKVF